MFRQRGEQVEDLGALDTFTRADLFRHLQRASADEDRQPPQQRTLRFGEQIVAPVDQRTERLLARQRIAAAAAEQVKTVVDPREDLRRGEQLHPRRRRPLDGEGNAAVDRQHRRAERSSHSPA